jgi:sugar phosphate isomerase/epimerase
MRYSYMVIDFATIEDDLNANLDFIKACGYEGVELNLTPDLLGRLDALAPVLQARGLVVPSFLTGAAYGEGLCLSVADPDRREGAVERLKSYLPIARRFNALLVVGLLQGFRRDEADAKVANQRIAAGLREVGLAAREEGVELVVEPINHLQVGFNNSVGEVRELIAAIDVPAFRPMVDTIHMNIEETSLVQPIYDCGEALRHVHLCESNGGVLGSGHLDFKAVLAALGAIGYEGFASVKVYRKASLCEAVQASLEHLRSASE